MLNLFYTFEILLFSIMNFAPFLVLSVFTFHKQMRFSKKVTTLLCVLLMIIQFATRYWCAVHSISLSVEMSLLRLTIFILCYIFLFEIHWGKVAFIELIFANMGNFIIIAAVCLERNMFPDIEHRLYCWHTSLAMFLLHLIITLPYSITVKRYIKPMMAIKSTYKRWYYYWLIPAIFYVIWQYQINGGEVKGLDVIMNPFNVIFLFIINIGSYLIYQLIIQLDSSLILNFELEKEKHFQDVEDLAYQLLEERITETRRARHDMRHHMIIIEDLLNSQDYDHLREYIKQFHELLPVQERLQFCSHRTINAILLYYGQKAKEQDIDYQVQISVPETIPIPNSDISVLLSNLIENALHACEAVTAESREIIIRGNATPNSLVVTIDNTCNNEVLLDKNGSFVTTKKGGSGIGVESAKHIVARYNGVFSAEKKENMFYVSFMLNL